MEVSIWVKIGTSVWLALMSAADIRSCRIPVWMLGAGGIGTAVVLLSRFAGNGWDSAGVLWGMIPGIILVAAALATGKVGYGDGIVLLLLGLLLGGGNGMLLFGISLLLISVCSLVLLILKKAGKGSRIPYLPFLTLSWIFITC